ncbi:MAG: hypothetical protein US52_C0060G0003 [candidate division WS6 bacterium GW2011_GWA2_37_6]|uniref:Uncharacterized protein n=1 Tax=candidate division WS6 bacterium GW2011_GWA2_37_6 TaxID=1619087 RepID=A0A0G0JCA4_9BACT|nr:MAG: hypothetical protein US52_C0060G0003 [candidate division WS6 bacterium GW2011_GWA2_37_6]
MRPIKTIIFDFDGVLCKDYFYTNLQTTHPKVSEFIETKIFDKGSKIPDKWMRGELSSDDINKIISKETSIDFKELSELFVESIKIMQIDQRLLDLAKLLTAKGREIALVTNNMDIFSIVTIPHNKLDKIFPIIVNSADHKLLKQDENGKLFDIAMSKLNGPKYTETLLIDDSLRARKIFQNKGGRTFPYKTYEQFRPWAEVNLLNN